MKLVSWNINGLRSAETKFLEFIALYQPDILMLQELRAFPDNLSLFLKLVPGYQVLFNPATRPGYSGTAVYYKDNLQWEHLSTETGNQFLNQEGRVIWGKLADIYIFNFYTPNGTGSFERLQFKYTYYRHMLSLVQELLRNNQKVILGGDLNVAHTEKDIHDPSAYLNRSGFLEQERHWFDEMLKSGLLDAYRELNNTGKSYTWWHMQDSTRTLNRGIRFDYFLISKNLRPYLTQAEILKEIFGSDHCPIEITLSDDASGE